MVWRLHQLGTTNWERWHILTKHLTSINKFNGMKNLQQLQIYEKEWQAATTTEKDLHYGRFSKFQDLEKGNLSVKLLRLKAFCRLHLRKGFYCKADWGFQSNLSAEKHKGSAKKIWHFETILCQSSQNRLASRFWFSRSKHTWLQDNLINFRQGKSKETGGQVYISTFFLIQWKPWMIGKTAVCIHAWHGLARIGPIFWK